ncbi:MAG: serine hydrolase [Rhizobium sp.]
MRAVARVAKGMVLAIIMALTAIVVWLSLAPPELLRVGTGYAAKIVCSNVFLAGRDADVVLASDVQAPGHPLLKLIHIDIDPDQRSVTARLLGAFAPGKATYREGLGCVSVPTGDGAAAQAIVVAGEPEVSAASGASWPEGDAVSAGDPRLSDILADPALVGPGMRAVVVVKDGRLVGEAYGEGFDASTPLLGWSMTKTVNAAIIGRLMTEGRIGFDDRNLLAEWTGDGRAQIRIRDLLAMEGGLDFDEEYGDVTDVTRMLYLERDMAAFAAARPLAADPGTSFNYASGASVLLAKIWMGKFADRAQALAYPRAALFQPLGMASAVMEGDATGTFVGSSYMYATARDWARFGLFLVQDGVWEGQRLLPEDFVGAMRRPTTASGGLYTEVQAWGVGPGEEPDEKFGIADDAFWLLGHDGQTIAVVPSENLVVVRLGLTPSELGYRPQWLVKAVADVLK